MTQPDLFTQPPAERDSLWNIGLRHYDGDAASVLFPATPKPMPIGEATEAAHAWRLEDARHGWLADIWMVPA